MREICQDKLPFYPWLEEKLRRLPGMQVMDPADWLVVDEAYGPQMTYREELLAERRDQVYQMSDAATPAAEEVLAAILASLAVTPGYAFSDGAVTCPDGRVVRIEDGPPLVQAARLVQEDLVLMEKRGAEYALSGAVLCFPASWSLAEKFNRGLIGIHQPVEDYDDDIARRVGRMFDLIKPERPMWRANALVYGNPDLHQPRREDARRKTDPTGRFWARIERQGLRRLANTGVVVFTIHTYVVPLEAVPEPARRKLLERRQSFGLAGLA